MSSSQVAAAGSPARRAPLVMRAIAALGALVAVLTLSACSIPGVMVVEKKGDTALSGPKKFNATDYVEGVWASKVVPAVTGTTNDAGTVLTALAADQDAAATQYGTQAGQSGPFTYLVKGTGTVTDVDTSSAIGRMQIAVDGAPKKTDVYLAIGPAFVGTAIRDGVGFIDFSQFTNQIDYADVGTALNAKVKTTVVNSLDPAAATGRTVTFAGAFSVIDPTSVIITPAQLTVGS